MTEKLREELVRIGDGVPPSAVAGDVWERGRRARRRGRLVAGGAVLSVLVVLAGLGATLRDGHHEVPPADSGVEAVPAVIHPVPERLGHFEEGADETWEPSVAETDLAIGKASVAFASGEGSPRPVVITAADGAYHLLRLPGWIGGSLAGYQVGTASLALSPDGRSLAWGWYDASTLGSDMVTAGVRTVDLETGEIRSVRLSGGHGIAVASVRWSPDSRWLVWSGAVQKRWEEQHTGSRRSAAGRIAPGSTRSMPLEVSRGGGEQLVIDNEGTVGWASGIGWSTVGRTGNQSFITDVLRGLRGSPAAVSPSGKVVAMATTEPGSDTPFVFWPRQRPIDPFMDQSDLPPWGSSTLSDRFPDGATVDPLGWIDESHVVELVTPAHDVSDGTWMSDGAQIAVVSLTDEKGEQFRTVGRVDEQGEHGGRIQDLTVAVDLMSLDHPTRDFPAPEWPWSDERTWVVWGGLALGVLAGVVFVLGLRRGRRLRGL